MNEAQLKGLLRQMAHYIVRNEIICEHFINELGISRDVIGAKVREIDDHLLEHTDWQNRFPKLFPDKD